MMGGRKPVVVPPRRARKPKAKAAPRTLDERDVDRLHALAKKARA